MTAANYASSIASSTVPSFGIRNINVNLSLPANLLDEFQYQQGRYIPKQSFVSNAIHTSKYTILTFIPKNLFEQFRKIANFFFLLLVIIQVFDEFKVVHPIVAAFPIMIIVSTTAVKDAIEDYRRWKTDKEWNHRLCHTLSTKAWRNYNYPDYIYLSLFGRIKIALKKLKKFLGKIIARSFNFFRDLFIEKKSTDTATDNSTCGVPSIMLSGSYEWECVLWKNLRVGDIVLLHNDDPIPADMILLNTSEDDCICYVETKNLDGETNLKLKQGPPELCWVKTAEDCASKIKLSIESEPPNTNMLRYQAAFSMTYDLNHIQMGSSHLSLLKSTNNDHSTSSSQSQTISKRTLVDMNGLVMRGSVIRNTKWIIGVVVFTGEDTKQIMNFGKTPSKRTNIDILMNKHVAVNLIFVILLCLVCAIGYPIWFTNMSGKQAPYVVYFPFRDPGLEGFITFWAGLILFQNIVPISLYISVEFVKLVQAFFIHLDLEMYYEEKDTPCTPRSWNLSDNLGQVEYIFSDKTGTLTRNIMAFKKCSIGGRVYDGSGKRSTESLSKLDRSMTMGRGNYEFKSFWLEGVHESLAKREAERKKRSMMRSSIESISLKKSNEPVPSNGQNILGEYISKSTSDPGQIITEKIPEEVPECSFEDEALLEIIEDPSLLSGTHGSIVRYFFTLLSVCHTVLVDEKSEQKESPRDTQNSAASGSLISYKAQSPDEACLVTMAAETGFIFRGRSHNQMTDENEIVVEIMGEECRFALLNVLEFDSDRKRMSVVVRPIPKNDTVCHDVVLFCKGADSVIFERLAPGQEVMMNSTSAHLESFAQEGLRTLCLACKIIPEAQFKDWSRRYHHTVTKVYNDQLTRVKALETLNNEIESNLTLLGATAIEDKLQEGVPQCIRSLYKAGIKIWVLTGDKVETAINVGFLCGLLKSTESINDGSQEQISLPDSEMVLIQVKAESAEKNALKQLQNVKKKFFSGTLDRKIEFALIIDGMSLKFLLDDPEAKSLLLEVACKCKAVICCRVSPLQKAKVVEMVKYGKNVLTLAIGDGANDVSMIQAADIGVGISGEEGLQAAMSADYAIAQFRYLKRLLLIHGRWCYTRTAFMILNFYLKSCVFSIVLFWFQFFCGFSGAIIYDFNYALFFNLIFTCLPIMFMGMFDQFLPDYLLNAMPQVYGTEGISRVFYSHTMFLVYFAESMWQSLVCFFVPYWIYPEGTSTIVGYSSNMLHLGSYMAFSAIVTVNLSVALDLHAWNYIQHLGIWFSCISVFVYVIIFCYIPNTGVTGMMPELFSDWSFWFSIVICIILSLGPRSLYYYYSRVHTPTDSQILEEIAMLIKSRKQKLRDFLSDSSLTSKSEARIRNTKSICSEEEAYQRKQSIASMKSISYAMDTGAKSRISGFSFASPSGMAKILLRKPMNAIKTFNSMGRRFSRSRTPDNGSIKKSESFASSAKRKAEEPNIRKSGSFSSRNDKMSVTSEHATMASYESQTGSSPVIKIPISGINEDPNMLKKIEDELKQPQSQFTTPFSTDVLPLTEADYISPKDGKLDDKNEDEKMEQKEEEKEEKKG